jgi:hypothetical protein
MNDLITFLRAQLTIDDRGLRDWLSNLPADSGAADWVRQWLADIDAKRRILEEHAYAPQSDSCRICWRSNWGSSVREMWPCPTVRLLALPYAERSSYQDQWRP